MKDFYFNKIIFTIFFLLVSCGPGSDTDSSPVDLVFESDNLDYISVNFKGKNKVSSVSIGKAFSLATDSFTTSLGLAQSATSESDPIYFKPTGSFDPDSDKTNAEVTIDLGKSALTSNLASMTTVIFYHIQKSKSENRIGVLHPIKFENNKLTFNTLGNGIYHVVKLSSFSQNETSVSSNISVFNESDSYQSLTGDNWKDDDSGDDDAKPVNAPQAIDFTGTTSWDDSDKVIEGDLEVTKALSEIDLDNYKVYWTDDDQDKIVPTPFATLTKNNADLTFNIANGTQIPSGATNFLVVSANDIGEMLTGASVKFACSNFNQLAPVCDQCRTLFTGYPTCSDCAGSRHTGTNCNNCKFQFSQDSFPNCDACAEPNMVNGDDGEPCGKCRFPAADISTNCTTCLNPLRTPPRCLF